jgi:hypothetical protein
MDEESRLKRAVERGGGEDGKWGRKRRHDEGSRKRNKRGIRRRREEGRVAKKKENKVKKHIIDFLRSSPHLWISENHNRTKTDLFLLTCVWMQQCHSIDLYSRKSFRFENWVRFLDRWLVTDFCLYLISRCRIRRALPPHPHIHLMSVLRECRGNLFRVNSIALNSCFQVKMSPRYVHEQLLPCPH